MKVHQVTYAGFWVRLIAFLLDMAFVASLLYLIFDILLSHLNNNFYVIIGKICSFCFYFFILTYLFGQTFGKMVVGIKIVPKQHHKIAWEEVLLREVIGKFLSIMFVFTGILLIALDPQKQSLHDKLGNMYVVWEQS